MAVIQPPRFGPVLAATAGLFGHARRGLEDPADPHQYPSTTMRRRVWHKAPARADVTPQPQQHRRLS